MYAKGKKKNIYFVYILLKKKSIQATVHYLFITHCQKYIYRKSLFGIPGSLTLDVVLERLLFIGYN